MSVSSGPNISTNGIILNLDTANRKSFSGIGVERIGTTLPTWSPWSGLTGSSVAYTGKNGKPAVYLNTIVGGGVNYWYSSTGGYTCLSSTQYMITARVRYAGSASTPSANLFYVRQYNSGGAQTSEGGRFTTGNLIPEGNDWYIAWALFTTDATAVSFYVHGYEYSGGMNIWLEDVQCKLIGMTDVVTSGNSTSLLNEPNFLSTNGGVYVFDGINDHGVITFTNKPTTAMTVSSWVYPTKAPSTGTIRGGALSSTNSMYLGIIDSVDGNATHSFHFASQTNSSRVSSWVAGIPQNQRTMITGTYDGATAMAYINGNLVWSTAQTGTIPDSTYYLGTYGPNPTDGVHNFQGKISASQIYNRALSSTEVKQNFNAHRGRFSI